MDVDEEVTVEKMPKMVEKMVEEGEVVAKVGSLPVEDREVEHQLPLLHQRAQPIRRPPRMSTPPHRR